MTVSSVELSADKRERYWLSRSLPTLTGRGGYLGFLMLNPSTADHQTDDKTVLRCLGFAAREGMEGIAIANLYSHRSPFPGDIPYPEPLSDRNADSIERLLTDKEVGKVICAWGQHPAALHRVPQVRDMIAERDFDVPPLWCFGLTRGGQPRHPLYLPKTVELQPFSLFDEA